MKKASIIIGIIAAVALVFVLARTGYTKKQQASELADVNQATALQVRENDWMSGNTDAKVVLVEYLDFECEACGAYYPAVEQLKKDYADDVLFVVRYLPLPGHKNSKTAAYAAEAAGKQGKFWEMYNVLFTKQAEWGEQQTANQEQFEQYAIEAGVDIEQWRIDVKSPEVTNRVDESFQEAMALKLQGTPSFFLNGKKMELPRSYPAFQKLIDDELVKVSAN